MHYLTASFHEWSPFLFILLAGALPTQVWRWAGAVLSRSMNENGELLKWVKAVATALVAGLVSKLIVFPSGALAAIPVWALVGSLLAGYLVFFLNRSTIILGILVAECLVILSAITLT